MKKLKRSTNSKIHSSPIHEKSEAELQFMEVEDLVSQLEIKLKKLNAMADELLVKSQISHSMIVVRKISEDKLDLLNQLLD